MLVLSRKADEAIWIGNKVRITVVEVRGNKVRLGIEAPDNVRVYRDELVQGGAFDFLDLPAGSLEAGEPAEQTCLA